MDSFETDLKGSFSWRAEENGSALLQCFLLKECALRSANLALMLHLQNLHLATVLSSDSSIQS